MAIVRGVIECDRKFSAPLFAVEIGDDLTAEIVPFDLERAAFAGHQCVDINVWLIPLLGCWHQRLSARRYDRGKPQYSPFHIPALIPLLPVRICSGELRQDPVGLADKLTLIRTP